MSSASGVEQLRERLQAHGFHLFLRPDRPSGWWVTIRNGSTAVAPPIEARAATRDDALVLAERLFVSHRLSELDTSIRAAGLTPPLWNEADQVGRLAALAAFAHAKHV